jgi:hypothetical protein
LAELAKYGAEEFKDEGLLKKSKKCSDKSQLTSCES